VGVTGYRLERCQEAGCSTFAQVATPTGTTYTDSGLSGSTSYTYRVRATDAAGNLSGYSATVTAATGGSLTAPASLVVIAASSSEIDLAWTASAGGTGTISYLVERCSGPACSSWTQIGAPSSPSYNSLGISPATSYSFRVRATDALGDLGPYSAVVAYTTPANTFPDCN
jgi:predicted phage tail protein